jgi:hypothetical protein
VAREVSLAAVDAQEEHGHGVKGDLPLGRWDVDVGSQEPFQVGVINEAQGDVEGGEGLQSLGVIEALRSQVAVLGAVAGFERGRQVGIEGKTQW